MIRAEVKYTEKHYRELSKCRNKISFYILGATALVNVGLLILLLLLSLVSGKGLPEDFGHLFGLVLFVVGMWSLDCLMMYVFFPKRAAKVEQQKFGESKVNFAFHADKFTAEHSGKDFSDKIELNYDKLDKVYETKEYFLLYLRSNTAFIIGKNEICEGSPQALRELLRTKFGKRYKTK